MSAADVATEVVESVEDVDGIVEVLEVTRNNPVVLAAVGALGLGVGVIGGYFLAKKILTAQFEDQMTVEIAEAKEFYAGLYKTSADGKPLTPQDVLTERQGAEALEALRAYSGAVDEETEEPVLEGEPHDDIVDEEIAERLQMEAASRVNVFADDTFDLEEEKKYRTAEAPYIITHDEYYDSDREFENQALTYYAGDDTLCDEHDRPLEDTDKIVGDDHLVRFGSGSKDKNIVYVRNERLEIDYEIVRVDGTYLEMVLGEEAKQDRELRHSADNRRAFRRGEG